MQTVKHFQLFVRDCDYMFKPLSLTVDNQAREVARSAESKSARPKSMHRLCNANVLSDRYHASQLIKGAVLCVIKLILRTTYMIIKRSDVR